MRETAAPTLRRARIEVEELAGHGEYLLLERRPEEAEAVVKRGREVRDRAEGIEGPFRLARHPHAHRFQALDDEVTFGLERGAHRARLRVRALGPHELD